MYFVHNVFVSDVLSCFYCTRSHLRLLFSGQIIAQSNAAVVSTSQCPNHVFLSCFHPGFVLSSSPVNSQDPETCKSEKEDLEEIKPANTVIPNSMFIFKHDNPWVPSTHSLAPITHPLLLLLADVLADPSSIVPFACGPPGCVVRVTTWWTSGISKCPSCWWSQPAALRWQPRTL